MIQKVDDAQRRLDLKEKDFNIIRQPGTALLGIGKANSSIVAAYGAGNTAYSGIMENFSGAVLAGPATAKVKVQVLDMHLHLQHDQPVAGAKRLVGRIDSVLYQHRRLCFVQGEGGEGPETLGQTIMPARTEVIPNVPEAQKARIEADYRSVRASVVWSKQTDGKWTGTASFPATGGTGS